MPQKQISFEWLGQMDFPAGLEHQRQTWERCSQAGVSTVLGLEHTPVVTLGKRSIESLDLKTPRETLEKIGISVVNIDRGGEAVLHNPGQMVIYPIFDLEKWGLTVRDFVCILEKTTIRFLNQLYIEAHAGREEPGIYTRRGKIAFIGIRVERGITRHGIAINVSNDLAQFAHIRCCGKADETFDRLARYGVNASQIQLFKRWTDCFKWQLSSSNLTAQRSSDYSQNSVTALSS